ASAMHRGAVDQLHDDSSLLEGSGAAPGSAAPGGTGELPGARMTGLRSGRYLSADQRALSREESSTIGPLSRRSIQHDYITEDHYVGPVNPSMCPGQDICCRTHQ